MAIETVMSTAGAKKLQDELEYLKTVRRKELADEIAEARSHGDLSENSEYDEAKNTQGLVENRINELEQILKNLRIDDNIIHAQVKKVDSDVVEDYDITSAIDADPFNNKISDESPMGQAIKGHKTGDIVEVTLPSGRVVVYEILSYTEAGHAE